MALTPEAIYLQLGQLVAEMPDLATGPITREMHEWMGRAVALVELVDNLDAVTLKHACRDLSTSALRGRNAEMIAAIVHYALAKAELNAPVGLQGAFIAAGSTFDAYAAVGKVLAMAKAEVLMVDPYADAKVLTDYGVLAKGNISVRLLSDTAYCYQATLKPAAQRWKQQFGALRPLEVRLAPARALHDRLIQVDGSTVWVLGQSFKDLAARSHTSLVRMDDPESAALKIAAYASLWQNATPL
jgi:hypothetical protein